MINGILWAGQNRIVPKNIVVLDAEIPSLGMKETAVQEQVRAVGG
jgi:hypothetical protein